jgi:hypothetical protein
MQKKLLLLILALLIGFGASVIAVRLICNATQTSVKARISNSLQSDAVWRRYQAGKEDVVLTDQEKEELRRLLTDDAVAWSTTCVTYARLNCILDEGPRFGMYVIGEDKVCFQIYDKSLPYVGAVPKIKRFVDNIGTSSASDNAQAPDQAPENQELETAEEQQEPSASQ